MKKSIEPKKKPVKKLGPFWREVRVDAARTSLTIARAIALARTLDEASNSDSPLSHDSNEIGLLPTIENARNLEAWDGAWSVDAVLKGALLDGLVAWEKKYLGTSSLDECEPAEGEKAWPRTTPAMLALVYLTSRKPR